MGSTPFPRTKVVCPDFYLPEYNLYLEIKGYFSLLDQKKMILVNKQNNINVIIIDGKIIYNPEEILKKIGRII